MRKRAVVLDLTKQAIPHIRNRNELSTCDYDVPNLSAKL